MGILKSNQFKQQQGGGLIEFANTQVLGKIKADLMHDVSPPRSNVKPVVLMTYPVGKVRTVGVGQYAHRLDISYQYMGIQENRCK